MNDVLKNRVDRFYPEGPMTQMPNSPQAILEQKQREEARDKVLKEHAEKKTAAQIAKLKAEAIARARVERARSGEQSVAAQEAERKARLLEAIEMQAAEEEAPQRAIIETAAKAAASPIVSTPVVPSVSPIAVKHSVGSTPAVKAAKELLTMNSTSRADVQRLLTNLNINMNLQLTKTDTANLLACLLTCNEQQLFALERNPKVPIAIKIVIKRLREDAAQGNMSALERIWDRVFGKAAMSLDLPEQATAAGIIPNTPISREAYVVIRETLLK